MAVNENTIGIASTGDVDWSVFLQEGVIVTLTIKRYRGVTSVDFSELGIDDSSDAQLKSFLGEYIQPGQKRLIPPEIEGQLKSIETTARQNLKDRSFDCSAFASSGKFVPKSMYPEFKAANEELADRFYAIRDEFAENYDTIIGQVRRDYKVLAENLYMQSHPDAKKPSAKYVNTFVDKIVAQIPSADEIVTSFEYSTVLQRIPDYLLRVISKKNSIDEKVMRIAATNQPKDDLTSRKRAAAGRAAGMDTADAAIMPDDDEAIDEIERDIRESISTQSEGMVSDFVTEILMRLRTMAYEGSSSIIQSIDKNEGKLVGRASIKAHSMIEDLRKMNFYGDTELEEMVAKLEASLGSDKSERDVAEVKQAAMELRAWSESSMDEIHASSVSRKASPAKRSAAQVKKQQATSTAAVKGEAPAGKKKVKISVGGQTRGRRTIKERS